MVAERNFLSQESEARITYRTVNILRLMVVARREFQRGEASVHSEM